MCFLQDQNVCLGIPWSQLIIASPVDEEVSLELDLNGDKEDWADVLILRDNNLEEEFIEPGDDQAPLEDVMEGLVWPHGR